MNGTLHVAFDEGAWTFVPRRWSDPVEGRSASRWTARTARRVVGDTPGATREQGRWFADSLLHLEPFVQDFIDGITVT